MKKELSKKLLRTKVMGLGLIAPQSCNPKELLKSHNQDLYKETQSDNKESYKGELEKPELLILPHEFGYVNMVPLHNIYLRYNTIMSKANLVDKKLSQIRHEDTYQGKEPRDIIGLGFLPEE